MKKDGYIKLRFFLIIVTIVLGIQTSQCQDVKSKAVRFKISNIPDTAPPVIKIMTPLISGDMVYQTDSDELVLIGEVKDESGVKFVSVNTDVRTINEAGRFTSRIELYPGENRIQLAASDNKENFHEQFITVVYTPQVVTLADRIRQESRYYALIIGVDKYDDKDLPDLDNPVRDAEKMQRALVENYTFNESDVILLRNPGRATIVSALDNLAKQVTPQDNVLIFFAGHGNWDEKANVGYWYPSDAYLTSTANWFRNSTLVDYLKIIDSKHTLLISDACFAGSILQTRSGFRNNEKAYEMLYALTSRKAMTSGTLSEVPDRSAFTRYLIDRLNDNEETYLSSEQLFSSFRIAVINNSNALPQYAEIKNVGDEGGDFIFLKKK